MKHIVKGIEPKEFTTWKSLENDDWIPTFEALSGEEKKSVLDSLKREQGYLCCYCERDLKGSDCHIEHLSPQDLKEVDPLSYSNMLCSCQQRLKKGEPRHCGNSKGNWYEEKLFISPLDPNCEGKFTFTFDGHINAASDNDTAASTTIEVLKLGIDKLNALRRKVIEPFIDEELSVDEVNEFAVGYLVSKEGRYNEFYTTVRYLFT